MWRRADGLGNKVCSLRIIIKIKWSSVTKLFLGQFANYINSNEKIDENETSFFLFQSKDSVSPLNLSKYITNYLPKHFRIQFNQSKKYTSCSIANIPHTV